MEVLHDIRIAERALRRAARIVRAFGFAAFIVVGLQGCGTVDSVARGLTVDGTLSACPSSPNCRCSDDADPGHAIAPLAIVGDPGAAWTALTAYLEQQPRVSIERHEDEYVHAVFTTRLLRFRDDVEFHLRPTEGVIAMRSASRVGHSDLGANKKRLESVRAAMIQAGVVSPQ